jgi:leader peptidase (prepilin peptidase)/N-methyltransferase
LGPVDLVPIASYFWLRGRCRRCAGPIARYYPLVEASAGLAGAVAFLWLPPAQALLAALLGWWLLALALVDLRLLVLPDVMTLPLAALGLGLAAGAELLGWPMRTPTLGDASAGAATGGAGLWLVGRAYAAWRKREGLGFGDAKLAAAAGAWLGWQPLPTLLLLAALGTLAGAATARVPMRADTALPLGPGLAGAFFALYLWLVSG